MAINRNLNSQLLIINESLIIKGVNFQCSYRILSRLDRERPAPFS